MKVYKFPLLNEFIIDPQFQLGIVEDNYVEVLIPDGEGFYAIDLNISIENLNEELDKYLIFDGPPEEFNP